MSGPREFDCTGAPFRGEASHSSGNSDPTANVSSPEPILGGQRHRLRICVVSSEFLGPFRNGGIGTAYSRLAELLARSGHRVTLLYTNGRRAVDGTIGDWVAHYRRLGLRLVPLPESPVHLASISPNTAVACRVYAWLRDHDGFDLVHFPEYLGHGYYALAARRQGLILRRATTVVGLHACGAWTRLANDRLARGEAELEDDFLERRSAELADVVWSPSRYMLDWAAGRGWELAGRTHVQPYVVPAAAAAGPGAPAAAARPVDELVFFGRQEVRKGLLLFLAAIDRLAGGPGGPPPDLRRVTILGKPTAIDGWNSERVIAERSWGWPFEVRVLAGCDERQATEYLRGDGRLAVIPSLVENYPNTVLECLAQRVPFLASRVGGIPEQVAAEDLERVCFEPEAGALADRLREALRRGQAPARLAFDAQANSRDWVHWHERLAAEGVAEGRAPAAAASAGPTISVCMAHYGRPDYLRQALRSIAEQECAPLEVIVVDDGSPGEGVRRELEAVEREFDFAGRGWRLIRQENRYLGAARNRAASEARGEYLLFMDDDNVAKRQEIATFAAVARHTGADLITCLMDRFQGPLAPWFYDDPELRCLFAGPVPGLSLQQNTFGDANALCRRAAFLAVGGFTEDYGIGHEDWELFARLMVHGYRITVIPEALFWYRESPHSMLLTTPERANYTRSLRPYLRDVPEIYHPLFEMAVGHSRTNPAKPAAPRPQPPHPLRYRLADALNSRLKRLVPIHRAIKRLAQLASGAGRAAAAAPRRIGSMTRSRVRRIPADHGADLIRHDGSSTHRPMSGRTRSTAQEARR